MLEGFSSLEDIIKNDPGLSSVRKVIKESDVIIYFSKIFPNLEKIALPVKVDKKVLFLMVENPAWRSELKFIEKTIIDKINKFFGDERIKWVKFTAR